MKALVATTDREFKKRNGNLPRDFLPNLETRWRQLRVGGQLSLEITRTRRTCTVVDTRLIPETLGNGDWGLGDTEPALIVVQNRYELTRHWTRTESVTIAAVGLHALGRYKGRADDPSDEAMMADIGALATTAVSLLTDPTAREISVSVGSGAWRGRVADFRDIHQSNRAARRDPDVCGETHGLKLGRGVGCSSHQLMVPVFVIAGWLPFSVLTPHRRYWVLGGGSIEVGALRVR
jgi:hypothetical protein